MRNKKPTLSQKIEASADPTTNELKTRVIAVKELLPKSGITSFLINIYPEYNNVKGRSLLSNVLQLRQADLQVTERLEKLAKTLNTNVNL